MKSIAKFITILGSIAVFCSAFAQAQSISVNESLEISIKGVPASEQARISGPYNVSSSGYVFMPLLKNGVKASGLSKSALARSIESAYKAAGMYKDPRITVVSTQDNAAKARRENEVVSIGGFVKAPGQRPFVSGMTLYQAVAAAGGATPFGSIRRVELLRKGRRTVYDLRKTDHMGTRVFPGDTINVPQKDWKGH